MFREERSPGDVPRSEPRGRAGTWDATGLGRTDPDKRETETVTIEYKDRCADSATLLLGQSPERDCEGEDSHCEGREEEKRFVEQRPIGHRADDERSG